jgi:hypothetical protein
VNAFIHPIRGFLESLSVGEPVGTPELTMFPLLGHDVGQPWYLTLDEGIAQSLVQVTEVSEAGQVPNVRVRNAADRPVLVLDGEELVGAKQNRVVTVTILVAARSELTIPVACVEAGRWHSQSREFAPADRTLHASGRRQKMQQVSASMRIDGSRAADQGAVWAEIDAKSARLGTSSDTRAAAAMYEQRHIVLDRLVETCGLVPGQVGAIFAIRGSLVGMEVFDHPDSWKRLGPKLLRSYALDALDREVGGNGFGQPSPTLFIETVASLETERFPAVGLGDDHRIDAPGVVGGALVNGAQVIHLTAFPRHGDVSARRRRGSRIH